MIQNPTILDKLKVKTKNDEVMQKFILDIMTNESEGKQYSKFFKSEIEKCAKIREKKGGSK